MRRSVWALVVLLLPVGGLFLVVAIVSDGHGSALGSASESASDDRGSLGDLAPRLSLLSDRLETIEQRLEPFDAQTLVELRGLRDRLAEHDAAARARDVERSISGSVCGGGNDNGQEHFIC